MTGTAAVAEPDLLVRHEVRIRRASIHYGCHATTFAFPSGDRPIVVYGPNGSGKTTFLEAIVRGMYGFNPRARREKSRLEDRAPWSAAAYRTVLTLETGDSVWTIERDFVSMEVALRRGGPDGQIEWEGGDGGGRPSDEREYRRRLTEILGLPEREAYENTAVLGQGWTAVGLGDHLLRVASGGHAPLARVKEAIQEGHQEVTGLRLDGTPERGGRTSRLQRIEAELIEMRSALDRARSAEERREPVVRAIDRLEDRLRKARRISETLESARSRLADRRVLESDLSRARDRLRSVETLQSDLRAAVAAEDDARKEWASATNDGELPRDLPERLARLEPLWVKRAALREERERRREAVRPPGRGRPLIAGGAAAGGVLALAFALWAGEWGPAAVAVSALLASVLLAGSHLRIRRSHERALAALESLESQLGEVDGAVETLAAPFDTPEQDLRSAPDLHERYERQERARSELGRAVERREAVEAWAGSVLAELDLADAGGGASDRIDDHLARLREERSTLEARMGELSASSLRLPPEVPAELPEVARAIEDRRREIEEIERELQEARGRLVDQASPREPSITLRDRISRLEGALADLRRRASAFEQAYGLVEDGYEAFRSRDQDRLVERISSRISELSGGAIGPVEVGGSLADATIRVNEERSLLIESPPLSFGEYQLVSLGIRLGASDFLTSAGVIPPFLADEPFAQLDDDAVDSVWPLLQEIARSRQIVLTVRSRRLLDQLRIEPDIDLEHGQGNDAAVSE